MGLHTCKNGKRRHHLWLLLLIFCSVACGLSLQAAAAGQNSAQATQSAASEIPHAQPGILPKCFAAPIVIPVPAPIPDLAELDPTTGLHYTGSGEPVHIDLATYRLTVDGLVDHPLSLSFDELRCLPKIERRTTIVCKGNFEDTAVWAGASLRYLLELAGIQPQAQNVRFYSADGYESFVLRKEAMSEKAFLAYEWERQPVPIIHGFPVRAALPGLIGANWVKWLVRIEVF
jgi:DMSO/TMAO reductase YedYZ molybdopterin-dependent catalytic subunit